MTHPINEALATDEEIAGMALWELTLRAEMAQKRVTAFAEAQLVSKARLGRLVRRLNTLPGATLEQVADVILYHGLKDF